MAARRSTPWYWLWAMDVTRWLSHRADRLWLWTVERAGNATDWGE